MLKNLLPKGPMLLVLGVILVLSLLSYKLIWQSQLPSFRKAEVTLAQEKARLASAQLTAARWSELEEEHRQAEQRLQRLKLAFARDVTAGAPLLDVSRGLDGLKMVSILPGKVRVKESYQELPVEVVVRGSYPSLLGFIQSLESQPQAVAIMELNINEAGGTGQNTTGKLPATVGMTASGTESIEATLIVSFYGQQYGVNPGSWGVSRLGRSDIFSPALEELIKALPADSEDKDDPSQAKSSGGSPTLPPTPEPPPPPKKQPQAQPPAVPVAKEEGPTPQELYTFPVR